MNDIANIDLQEGLPHEDATPTVCLKRKDGTWKSLDEIEREAAVIIIASHGQSHSEAARVLGIGRSTLYRRFLPRRTPTPQVS